MMTRLRRSRQWIKAGVPYGDAAIDPEAPAERGSREALGVSASRRPAYPVVHASWMVRNPIDAFIAAEQEKRGLTPLREADKRTLLRRVYLDLIGLPPTPADVPAFLADNSAHA